MSYVKVQIVRANGAGMVARWLNPQNVMWVGPLGSKSCVIRLSDGDTVQVLEPSHVVAERLAAAVSR
jgi:hypothetical protein